MSDNNSRWEPEPAELLENNESWVKHMNEHHPGHLETSTIRQQPRVLWIGCVDSRVPESVITNVLPGALFVHRNIANQFMPKEFSSKDAEGSPPRDLSGKAALEFAVNGLEIKQVVVVGHSECGGVRRAMEMAESVSNVKKQEKNMAEWLGPLVELAEMHQGATLEQMIEENVKRQVQNVREALGDRVRGERTKAVQVHGWVYDLHTGYIRDLQLA